MATTLDAAISVDCECNPELFVHNPTTTMSGLSEQTSFIILSLIVEEY